jgi:hypothetical protein
VRRQVVVFVCNVALGLNFIFTVTRQTKMLAISPVSDDASLVKVPSVSMLWSLHYIHTPILRLPCLRLTSEKKMSLNV